MKKIETLTPNVSIGDKHAEVVFYPLDKVSGNIYFQLIQPYSVSDLTPMSIKDAEDLIEHLKEQFEL